MRVLFAGSPSAATPTLQALVDSAHTVVGVLTQPARLAGRRKVLVSTAVELQATALGVPVFTPESSAELVETVQALSPDLAVVVAYGRILSQEAISAVPLGWWNVHFSLLPRWRGAAPVHHALAAGDKTTGISLFRIVSELDAGPVVAVGETPIDAQETAGMLLHRLARLAPALVTEFLDGFTSRPPTEIPQSGEPSFAPKIPAGAGLLDLSWPLADVYQAFRSFTPEPGAFVVRADTGKAVKLLGVWPHPSGHKLEAGLVLHDSAGVSLGTKTTPLILRRVQPAGKSEMEAEDWFRGLPDNTRMRVGSA